MEEKTVWLVNISSKLIEKCITEVKKYILFEPRRPIPLPQSVALKHVNHSLQICDDPEKYFRENPLKHLIVRDAGIGDLLLLEPCLRKAQRVGEGKRLISIVSRYPEVYDNNPYLTENIKMASKKDLGCVEIKSYDCWDDLRNYSESCVNREKKHRTECYNQVFNLDMTDDEKEPKLFFSKDEKQKFFKKKEDNIYIGINFDASHYYRKYFRGPEVIKYILEADKKNNVVIIGSYDFVKYKKNKRVIDLQGKSDIRQMINVVRDLDYLIATDSGVMHVGLTLHVPTVCIFSIINPVLRNLFYKGQFKNIYDENLGCSSCGSFHMAVCQHGNGDRQVDEEKGFIPQCMDIEPRILYDNMKEMSLNPDKRIFYKDEIKQENKLEIVQPINEKNINFNRLPERKLTMPIIVQDEAANLPRFIENVINHPAIGRVIAIDGGSKDNTVSLLEKAGAEVYVHPYIKTYHMQQAIQREISFSYISDGTPCIFFDIDESMNKALYDYLPQLTENCPDYALIARKTFNYYADINDETKRIKDWPDKQPRVVRWNKKYKFVNGVHHQMINSPIPISLSLNMFIIHFERENKDRDALEKQWSQMMQKVKAVNG